MSKLKEYLEASKKTQIDPIDDDDDDLKLENAAMDVLTKISNSTDYKTVKKQIVNIVNRAKETYIKEISKKYNLDVDDLRSKISDICYEQIENGDADLMDIVLSGK